MSDDNIVSFPGQDISARSGQPRHDMARMLRDLADRAERGELDTFVGVASVVNAGMVSVISTPENAFYSTLGALEAAKHELLHRGDEPQSNLEKDYD